MDLSDLPPFLFITTTLSSYTVLDPGDPGYSGTSVSSTQTTSNPSSSGTSVSSTQTTSNPSSSSSPSPSGHTDTLAIALGVALGFLVVVGIAVGGFLFGRYRRGES
jgi:hypothetical protein